MGETEPTAARLPSWANRVISSPPVYRAQTRLLGRARMEAALGTVVGGLVGGRPSGDVVDVGGGIAPYRALWPPGWTYFCVDPDSRAADADPHAGSVVRLEGRADSLPIGDAAADMVFMSSVSHHLDDRDWPASLREVARVLRPDGVFVFVDGVWSPSRWVSRLGWLLDGGGHPRTASDLQAAIADEFVIDSVERLTLLHEVVIVVARPGHRGE